MKINFDSNVYASAQPFPHAIIDNFLPTKLATEVCNTFPDPKTTKMRKKVYPNGYKYGCSELGRLSQSIRDVVSMLSSSSFLLELEKLTGINNLCIDPSYEGAICHLSRSKGFLNIHADFNIHPKLKLLRRVNLLIYLSDDWVESSGGHLELWSKDMSKCVQKISLAFNRAVIFNTSDTSYHGHPHPFKGENRKSIALYYFQPLPEDAPAKHSTLYQQLP